MDLGRSTETFFTDDQSWLGSAHGTQMTRTVTLDVSVGFVKETHYPKGFVPSGTALGLITATARYGPYDNTAADGREVLAGFLLDPLQVRDGVTRVAGALLDHGRVIAAKLPFSSGAGSLDAAGRADVSGRLIVV